MAVSEAASLDSPALEEGSSASATEESAAEGSVASWEAELSERLVPEEVVEVSSPPEQAAKEHRQQMAKRIPKIIRIFFFISIFLSRNKWKICVTGSIEKGMPFVKGNLASGEEPVYNKKKRPGLPGGKEMCMNREQFFTARRLPHGVTEITDLSGVHCFLVEGQEKALLVDTMTGLRGLRDFVAGLTDLPVEVVLTHGHMDHAGGVYEFGRCRMHPADRDQVQGETLPARLGYVQGQLQLACAGEFPEEGDFVPDGPVEILPLQAGDRLDLGGRWLEVIEVPGHTRGSLCFLDSLEGDFFAGDACNNNTLLVMDHSATIGEYLAALEKLRERLPEIGHFYLFHGPTPVDKSCVEDNIQCCREILQGTDDRVPVEFLGRTGYLAKERVPGSIHRKDGKFGNIMYTPEKVR